MAKWDLRERLGKAQAWTRTLWAGALNFWAALGEGGWPTQKALRFLNEPPRWFKATVFAVVFLIAGRGGYLIVWGSAEEANKFMVGAAAFLGAPFLVWRTWIADRQRHVAQEELYTSLLTKAVDQLGATREEKKEDGSVKTVPNVEVRLGAIYALEKLARDYLPLHWQIIEILCAFVRNNAGPPRPCSDEIRAIYRISAEGADWLERKAIKDRKALLIQHEAELRPPFVDVQAALTVIGRRSEKQREWEKSMEAESIDGEAIRFDFQARRFLRSGMFFFPSSTCEIVISLEQRCQDCISSGRTSAVHASKALHYMMRSSKGHGSCRRTSKVRGYQWRTSKVAYSTRRISKGRYS